MRCLVEVNPYCTVVQSASPSTGTRTSALVALTLLVALAPGCDGRPRRREPPVAASRAPVALRPPAAASVEQPLEIDDGEPVAPPGDLAEEIAAFASQRDCVAKHRVQDPLVADALDGLGYDGFVGDACRSLRALKERGIAPCREVLSSAVRERCETNVAVLVGEESLCPVRERVSGFPEHDPVCLAGARRDVRPCAAFVGFERAACEGLVARDVSRCGTEPRCKRRVARWKSSLPVPRGEAPVPSRVELIVRSLDPGVDGGARDERHELVAEAEAGALVVRRPGSLQVLIGEVLPLPSSTPRAGFALELPDAPRPRLVVKGAKPRVTVRLPPGTVLELAPRAAVDVDVASLSDVPGTIVELSVSADVGERPNLRRVELRVRTWVRDVTRPSPRAPVDPSPFTTLPPEP